MLNLHLHPQRPRMENVHLDARATTATAVQPKIAQPTDVIALTTAFTPPKSCFDNILTMLPPPGFQIWVNEPVPAANNTVAACYPSEYMQSYTSVVASSTASSVVPAMSPFVCPKNYCTMFAEEKNYIACCPSGYQFHPPDKTVVSDRPAYGGTCYSDLPQSTNIPVIAYDADGETASKVFSASTSGAQAYAHPIDGWALTSPTMVGCPTATSSSVELTSSGASQNSTSSASSTDIAAASTPGRGLSYGAIIGVSVGGCIALALIIGLICFMLLRRRRAHRTHKTSAAKKAHVDSFEMPAGQRHELRSVGHGDFEKYHWITEERHPVEMPAISAVELPGHLDKETVEKNSKR